MKLDADEKGLLESFERSEWKSTGGGERERVRYARAETLHADLLLIDEAAGRAEAKRRHLRVTGTLGVLRSGAEQGLVDVPNLLERLRTTSFYLDDAVLHGIGARLDHQPELLFTLRKVDQQVADFRVVVNQLQSSTRSPGTRIM